MRVVLLFSRKRYNCYRRKWSIGPSDMKRRGKERAAARWRTAARTFTASSSGPGAHAALGLHVVAPAGTDAASPKRARRSQRAAERTLHSGALGVGEGRI
ncbi:hypothetical protein MTO96_017445 [Rhipicephalus appendiculatus]